MIKCIIFDCDGTLVDSEYLCNLALEIKLRDYHVKSSAAELVERFRGVKLTAILETMELEHHITLKDDFEAGYRALVNELFLEQLTPCEGVEQALSGLSAYPKCVASSGPLKKINSALTITRLSGYFKGHIFSAHEVGSWKPDPGLFLHAAAEMGFKPEQCAVVEDSEVGIIGAQAAGMMAILYDPHGIYDHNLSKYRISHMKELQGIISAIK